MIEPEPGIALPAITRVIPKGIHRRVGVQGANGIDPALIEKAAEQGARLRLYECIVIVGFRLVNIRVGGYDIVIAGQHDRRVERDI